MSLRAGDLNTYVSIESPTITLDANGIETKTWSSIGSDWAKIRAMRGRELFAARESVSDVDVMVTLRYRSDVTQSTRIVDSARSIVYDVHAVMPAPMDGRLDLHCKTGLTNG